MSEIRIPIKIDNDALARYFSAKNVSSKCPQCSTSEWTVHETDNYAGVGLTMMDLAGRLVPGSNFMPAVALTCDNCYYLWLIARFPVEDWVKENPPRAEQ